MVRVEARIGSGVSVEIFFLMVSDSPFHSHKFDKATINYKAFGSVMASFPLSSYSSAHLMYPHFHKWALFSFVWWGETETAWYVSQYLDYCTIPGLLYPEG
jgi:hypothetical protein